MIADLGKSIGGTLQGLFSRPVNDAAVDDAIKSICMTLIRHNVNPLYVAKLRDDVKARVAQMPAQSNANKARMVQKAVFGALVELLSPGTKPYAVQRGRCNVVAFVGLQGCGKTTSICKYALHYKKKGVKVGIVCADTFRAGAFAQVRQNATKIGVPYFGSGEADPVEVARQGVARFRKADFELILVDTSGRHVQEGALFEEMRGLVAAVRPDNIVFVMDAGIGQSAEDQARGFRDAVAVGGIILTKLDGAEKAGGALSSVAATRCPIEFVGVGEAMEDLEEFNAKRYVSKLLGMGDIEGLMEAIGTLDIDQEELAEKMTTGKFKLADFKKICKQFLGLGPVSKMLGMMPGMQNLPIPDESKFKRICYIFDSFSKSELGSNGEIFARQPSRITRVARGSGCSEDEVKGMILNFKQMNNVMKTVLNNPMLSNMMSGMSESMGGGSFDNYMEDLN
ncbi:signal recognition particle subunit SRP54 [Pancytospora philotis]|nr:signal recognition particle subunit SRP54 [Pancytospora philotis]